MFDLLIDELGAISGSPASTQNRSIASQHFIDGNHRRAGDHHFLLFLCCLLS
jgi:hypothetical protein